MRKILGTIGMLLLVSAFSFGQLSYGPKAGLNFATLGGKDAGGTESRTTVEFGGFVNYEFAKMFAIQPELVYSMKGATQKGIEQGVPWTATWSLSYLQVPALLKLNIPLAGAAGFSPNIFAGPAFAINLSSKVEVEAGTQTQETDLKDNTSGTDFALVFGGGSDFGLGVGTLSVDIRYWLGLTSTDDTANNAELFNRVFSISVGYAFR